jgi:hypothetical protein
MNENYQDNFVLESMTRQQRIQNSIFGSEAIDANYVVRSFKVRLSKNESLESSKHHLPETEETNKGALESKR